MLIFQISAKTVCFAFAMRRSGVRSSSAPPKFSAQLFSVGRFYLCFPHDTQGSRSFCVCDQGSVAWREHPRLPSVPPSLLSKSALTSSPWHTQTPGDLLPSSVQHRNLTFAFVKHNRRAARNPEHENQQGIGLMLGKRLPTSRFLENVACHCDGPIVVIT